MASNTRGPRGRSSRKSRPRASGSTAQRGQGPTGSAAQGVQGPTGSAAQRAQGQTAPNAMAASPGRSRGRRTPAYRNFDERPEAPWHPLPLSELLILAGAIAFVIALTRLGHHGIKADAPLLLAGILAVGIGTAEVSWREHRTGFRSHTLLLAFVPVLALHTLVVGGYSAFASPPRALNLAMFAVDIAVFAALARYLRARYLDARARR